MESQSDQPPLIVIVGETASGKSALALELAQLFNGEIIAADSRTIYQGLDVVTAKPTPAERALVSHHLLDVVTPDRSFSAAEFKAAANQAIHDIAGRGRLPFLVGGTGLYVDGVIYNFEFQDKADPVRRANLQQMPVEQLQDILNQRGIPLPQNERNPRHLIRAIETGGQVGVRHELRPNTVVIGMTIGRDELRKKIVQRVDAMVESGLLNELRQAAQKYGWDAPGLQAPGFKAFKKYCDGEMSLYEAKELFVRNDLQLAKRQRTWFRRNKDIHWLCKKEEAVDLITTFLNK